MVQLPPVGSNEIVRVPAGEAACTTVMGNGDDCQGLPIFFFMVTVQLLAGSLAATIEYSPAGTLVPFTVMRFSSVVNVTTPERSAEYVTVIVFPSENLQCACV